MKKNPAVLIAAASLFVIVLLAACSPGTGSVEELLSDQGSNQLASLDSPSENEMSGAVTRKDGSVWAVEGTEFTVTDSTEFDGQEAGQIAVGDQIKVHVTVDENGASVAREIASLNSNLNSEEQVDVSTDDSDDSSDNDSDDSSELEISGELTAMEGSVWKVDDTEFSVTGDTEIKGQINLGDMVKVELIKISDTELVAHEIELLDDDRDADEDDDSEDDKGTDEDADSDHDDDDDHEIKITGELTSMDGSVWKVGDTEFTVNGDTKIEDEINLGDMVKVELIKVSDSELVAHEIELLDDDHDADQDDDSDDDNDDDSSEDNDDSSEVKITGELTAMDGSVWKVGDTEFTVNGDTKIEDEINLGDMVMVELIKISDTELVAHEIELLDDDHDADEDDDSEDDEGKGEDADEDADSDDDVDHDDSNDDSDDTSKDSDDDHGADEDNDHDSDHDDDDHGSDHDDEEDDD